MENKRNKIELADIFRKYGDEFVKNQQLCSVQLKAIEAITNCRTSQLGGHIDKCDHCGHKRPSYNSCRNRHCPKCQFVKQIQWVDKLKSNLPPTRYFHLVFTIPQQLHKIFYINQSKTYSLLFKAASEALKISAANPKFLGAQTGAVAVLHTWGQTLTYHPHIHMIVPAGGLSEDEMEWVAAGKKFLLPVKVLSKIFRGILCKLIGQGILKNEVKLPDDVKSFEVLKNKLYLKNWNVYSKKPFGGPDSVIKYLGNYTHRVAISNHRIISDDDGKITFRYKDYKSGVFNKTITLDADEFIGRFLRHILPCGFYKIRYFGILASVNAQTKTALCFCLLDNPAFLPQLEGLPAIDIWRNLSGKDPAICPICKKGIMRPVAATVEIKEQPT
ncbi:MAG: IS91 family transposase [Mariniphaga sp.]|nr:IS91 family transposase [Mariniphaga sp.]